MINMYKNISAWIQCGVILILTVALVVLYFKLIRILKKNLNHYYQTNKTNLRILVIFNFLSLQGLFVANLLKILGIDDRINEELNDFCAFYKVMYTVYSFILNFNIFFFIYFNVKNINFKKYLQATYEGLGIAHRFEGASIFIVKSCLKPNKVHIEIKDGQVSVLNPDTTYDCLYNSIHSESDDMSDCGREAQQRAYTENFLKLHNKI